MFLVIAAILFFIIAALQFNDPDPFLWVALYAGVGFLTLIVFKREVPKWIFTVLAAPIALWSISLLPKIVEETAFTGTEVEREFGGLVLTLFWLIYLRFLPSRS